MHSAALPFPNGPDQLKAEVAQLQDTVKEKEQDFAEKKRALNEKEQRIEQLLDYTLPPPQ